MKTKTEFLKQLAQNIRTQRQLKQFTQESFAKHTQIARRYYGDIETGKINPSIVHLMKIALGLDVPLMTLIPVGFSIHAFKQEALSSVNEA